MPSPAHQPPADFKPIIKTNAAVPGSKWRWGQVRSSTGAALFEVDPATKGPSTTPLVSNNPDFTSLHEVSLWGCCRADVQWRRVVGWRTSVWCCPGAARASGAPRSPIPYPAVPAARDLAGPHHHRQEDGVRHHAVRVASPWHHVRIQPASRQPAVLRMQELYVNVQRRRPACTPLVSLPVSMAAPDPSVSLAPAPPSSHPATSRWVTGLEQGKDGSLTPKGQYYVDWSKQVSQAVILLHPSLRRQPHRAEG